VGYGYGLQGIDGVVGVANIVKLFDKCTSGTAFAVPSLEITVLVYEMPR